jgi:hypothetical protein
MQCEGEVACVFECVLQRILGSQERHTIQSSDQLDIIECSLTRL